MSQGAVFVSLTPFLQHRRLKYSIGRSCCFSMSADVGCGVGQCILLLVSDCVGGQGTVCTHCQNYVAGFPVDRQTMIRILIACVGLDLSKRFCHGPATYVRCSTVCLVFCTVLYCRIAVQFACVVPYKVQLQGRTIMRNFRSIYARDTTSLLYC